MAATADAPAQTALAQTPHLPDAVARRGIDEFQWRTLTNNLFPGARTESVLMVVDYCKARRLDPLKKPCHIVPMEVKDAKTNTKEWRDVVMPGIYEYRITAHRTGLYLGHSKPEYGPAGKCAGVDAPAWCEMTMYRWHKDSARVIEFPVQVFFEEVVAVNREGKANSRWSKAPTQMLTKCTEAAGLREAFPEEFGSEPTAEEMEGQNVVDVGGVVTVIPMPERRSEQAQATTAASESATGPQPPAPQAEAEALPGGADRLVEVKKNPSRTEGKFYWTVTTERGVKAYTWSTTIGPKLEECKAGGALIDLDTEKDSRGENKIVAVQPFDALGGAGREPGAEG